MKEMQVELEKVKKDFESTDKEEGDLKSKEIDLKHEHQKFENTVKENHSKIQHWKNKVTANFSFFLFINSLSYSISSFRHFQPYSNVEGLPQKKRNSI